MNLCELGETPPPARLAVVERVGGRRLKVEVLWDPDAGEASAPAGGGDRGHDAARPVGRRAARPFIALHKVEVAGARGAGARALRAEHDEAPSDPPLAGAPRPSRCREVARLGGELEPFQWAGVRYVLEARRAFLADEPGLGKTVEALAALEADGAFPAVVVCPASLSSCGSARRPAGCRTARSRC